MIILLILLLFPSICQANTRDGLVGWWKFDEASGNAVDSSGSGNTGTINNSPSRVSNCKRSACLNFTGVSGAGSTYVDAGTNIEILSSWSLSAWVYLNNITATAVIVGRSRIDTDYKRDYVMYLNSGHFILQRNDGSTAKVLSSTGVYSVNNWYHVAGTFDGTNGIIYVNGVSDGTANIAVTITSDSARKTLIGNFYDSSSATLPYPVNGLIDDVRVYNRVLTAQEVKNLYNAEAMLNYAPSTI